MNISNNDFQVLLILNQLESFMQFTALSLEQLSNESRLTIAQLRTCIKTLKLLRYINDGALQGHSKTYYIAASGIEKLKELE